MKKIKLTNKVKAMVAVLVAFASIGLFNALPSASEDFSIQAVVAYSDDAKEATIKLDKESVSEDFTLKEVKDPQGNVMNLTDLKYVVDNNGIYNFRISYFDNEEEKQGEYTKEVKVDGIKKEVKEAREAQGIQPTTITSPNGDSLTVEFEKDNTANVDWSNVSQVDWNFYDIEKVEITATFSQQGTNKPREILVDVPDGYRIIGYSAKIGTVSQNGETILGTTESAQQAMISSSLTSQNGEAFGSEIISSFRNTNNSAFTQANLSGKIKYVFNSDAETVILTLQLGIDQKLYDYSDTRARFSDPQGTTILGTSTGQLLDDLSVTLISGSETLEETVQANVKNTWQNMYLHSQNSVAQTFIESSNYSPDFFPFGNLLHFGNTLHPFSTLVNEFIVTYEYPEGAEFVSMSMASSVTTSTNFANATNMTYVDDIVNRRLIVTYTNFHTSTHTTIPQPLFRLSGDTFGLDSGKQIQAQFRATIALKTIGSEGYLIQTSTPRVTVVDPDVPLTLVGHNQQVWDYTLNGFTEGYQFLGNHSVSNPAFIDKIDVDLEWTFDSSLGVRIARVAIPSGSTISDVILYTTKNPTGISIPNMRSSHNVQGTGAIVDLDRLDLDADDFITKIEGVIDVYPARADNGSAWAGYTGGYEAIGNIQNGTGGSHTLTIDGVSSTVTVTSATNRVINSGNVTANNLASAYYPGDSIPVNTSFTAATNSFNRNGRVTDNFLQDPNVYIRVPEGFELDETSLSLVFGTINVTDKATLAEKYVAGDGATIYKYVFNDPFTVMAGVQSKGQSGAYTTNTLFRVNFDLKVAVSNQGVAALPLRDIIMIEGKGSFVAYDGSVNFIRNDDFGLTSTGNNLMVPQVGTAREITVVKLPELQVLSGIRVKDSGDAFITYDGTESTIVPLSRTAKAEVEVTYNNNAPNSFDTANIYFPVPKAGVNHGPYFNNKAISDPLNASEIEPFTWSANITGEVVVPGFRTYYATDGAANATANDGSLSWEAFVPASGWKTYAQVSASLEDVIFLKFVADNPIASGESGSFTFELEVASDSPVDEVNYWRTYSGAQPTGTTRQTWVVGAVLAATPSVGEISGFVFHDNNANGVFDAGDTVYSGGIITINLTEADGKITTTTLPVGADGRFSIERLKEGDYTISVVNSNNANYHFSKTTASTSTVFGSNVTPNATHTEGRLSGLHIEAGTSEVHDRIGIGLISKIDTSYEFESRVMADTSLNGLARMVISGTQIEHNGTIVHNAFPQETFSVTPNVALPAGMTHVGWQLYIVDGSGVPTAHGSVIAPTSFATTPVPVVPAGSSLLVKAIVSYGPTINANDIVKYVGDNVNLLESISATNESGVSITLNSGALGNTVVSHSISIVDAKYSQAGTYQVTIRVNDVVTGSYSEETRLVRVHEAPIVSATHQEYVLGSAGIMSNVLANPNAAWKEAGTTAGSTPTVQTISGPADAVGGANKIKAEIISGPSSDFSVAGIYKVTYTAQNADGRTGSITVDVLIKPAGSITDSTNTLSIDANNFILENAQAAGLSAATSRVNGNASAYTKTFDAFDNQTGYAAIAQSNIQVNATELAAIQAAPTTGGIYDLTFTVSDDGKTVSKTIKVLVKPLGALENDDIIISATGFTISYTNALTLDNSGANTNGASVAYLVERDAGGNITGFTQLVGIVADGSQLSAINGTSKYGGVFDLEYTAVSGTKSASVTVKVNVLPATGIEYKVEHYLEQADGTYTLADSYTLAGSAGASVSASANTYVGFTFDSTVAGTKTSGSIIDDGSLVLKLFYRANTDTVYVVEHYHEQVSGMTSANYVLVETETLSGTTGSTVNAVAKSYATHSHDASIDGTVMSGEVAADGTLVLRVFYSVNSTYNDREVTITPENNDPGANGLPITGTNTVFMTMIVVLVSVVVMGGYALTRRA